MPRPKKIEKNDLDQHSDSEVIENPQEKIYVQQKKEKEKLLELYQTLKDLGINSIGDLEVRISRL